MAEWRAAARLDPARWVAWDGTTWTADTVTAGLFRSLPQGPYGPVPMSPVGPVYTPEGQRDPVAVFLHAAAVLPGGLVTTGAVPAVPSIPPVPAGAVA